MPINLTERMFRELRDTQRLNRLNFQRSQARDAYPMAFGVKRYTVAGLPTTDVGNGNLAFATNGRKVGEGMGAGTGVLVYYAEAGPSGAVWYRASDDTQVVA